jgi:hypothetical protein
LTKYQNFDIIESEIEKKDSQFKINQNKSKGNYIMRLKELDPEVLSKKNEKAYFDAWKGSKSGDIRAVLGPGGSGKTYSIASRILPREIIENDVRVVFYIAPSVDLVTDAKKELKENLEKELAGYNYSLEFNENPKLDPIDAMANTLKNATPNNNVVNVIILTLQKVSFNKEYREKFSALVAMENFPKAVMHIDEGDFASTLDAFWAAKNYGRKNGKSLKNYEAACGQLIQSISEKVRITLFTATPNHEINSPESPYTLMDQDPVSIKDLATKQSHINEINVTSDGALMRLKTSLRDKVMHEKNMQAMMHKIPQRKTLKFNLKTILWCRASQSNTSNRENADLKDIILKSDLTDFTTPGSIYYLDRNEKSLGIDESAGVWRFSLNDILKLRSEESSIGANKQELNALMNSHFTRYKKDEKHRGLTTSDLFLKDLRDQEDPLRFVFFVGKYTRGISIGNISHHVTLKTSADKEYTNQLLQDVIRIVRPNFGIEGDVRIDGERVAIGWNNPHAMEFAQQNSVNDKEFRPLKGYMMGMNGSYLYGPNTKSYKQTMQNLVLDPTKYPHTIMREDSLWANFKYQASNIVNPTNIDVDSYLKSPGNAKQRDSIYKKYKKNRCEHPGCNCYEATMKACIDFGITDKDEQEAVYFHELDVDHDDGDPTNNDPDNLRTLCSGRHRNKTFVNREFLNKPDLAAFIENHRRVQLKVVGE